MMQVKVEKHEDLVRDSENGAILSTNKQALNEYRAAKRKRTSDNERLNKVCAEVDEMKSMLKAILDKLNG